MRVREVWYVPGKENMKKWLKIWKNDWKYDWVEVEKSIIK